MKFAIKNIKTSIVRSVHLVELLSLSQRLGAWLGGCGFVQDSMPMMINL